MATWKKIVVSGSLISQLNNDAGYLTSATTQNSFSTASVNGVVLTANSPTGSLTFASSSGQGLTLLGTSNPNIINFGLSAVPNTSLANSSITIAGNSTSLGGSITAATILAGTGVFSGSAQVTGLTNANLSGTAGITNANLANSSITVGSTNIALGATATNLAGLTSVTSTSFTGSLLGTATTASFALTAPYSGLTGVPSGLVSGSSQVSYTGLSNIPGGIISGSSQVITLLPTGTVSGSSQINYSGISGVSAGIVSASAISSPSQGNVTLTTNGISATTTPLGLRTSDSPTFTDLTLSGNLTVNGTTTTINTANLNVADKFILLSSGSTSANDGGIIIQSAIGGLGFAYLYDSAQARWGFTGSLSGGAASAAPDAFVSTVIDLNVTENIDVATYQKPGNIKIATNQDIYIYS